jgi:hypothetical protein
MKKKLKAWIVIYSDRKNSASIQFVKPTKKEIESAKEFRIEIKPCVITY